MKYAQITQFSDFDQAFQSRDDKLKPFVGAWPEQETLIKSLQSRSFDTERRRILVDVLKKQYQKVNHWSGFSDKINQLLDDDVFTIVTAHQPVLFGGPLYVPYKIASAIHLARSLNTQVQERKVVPVFIVGGEDHDFAEMNHCHIYGKSVEWQHEQGGPVGRFDLNGLTDALDKVEDILGESKSDVKVTDLLRSSFSGDRTYGEAYQDFIISLFGQYGLIVINMDDAALKTSFKAFMQKELIENLSKPLVMETQEKKEKAGFSAQTYVRDINLFYVDQQNRSVILKEDEKYNVRDLEVAWSREEVIEELNENTQKFSPNVVMRPIYQEYSLPNIAYIGGGGELSYWSERQSQFQAFGVEFPILVRRSSALHLEGFIQKRMEDSGVRYEHFSQDKHEVIKSLVSQDTTLDDELKSLSQKVLDAMTPLVEKLETQSDSLGQYARSEERKLEKTLENFQAKSFRELKKEYDVKVGKIEKVFDQLFPNGGLQERHDNFLSFLNRHGSAYLDFLVDNLDPLEQDVKLIVEKD